MSLDWSVLIQPGFWMRAVHLGGAILSVGAVTVTDSLLAVLHFRPRLAPLLSRLVHVLSLVVWLGLLLLSTTGVYLVLANVQSLSDPVFHAKIVLVMLVFINGIIMNLYIAPRFEDLSDEWHRDLKRVDRFQKLAGIAAVISLVGWWSIVVLVLFNRYQ